MWLNTSIEISGRYGGEETMIPITIHIAVHADAPDMAEIHMRSWEAAYKDIIPAEYNREKNAGRPALWERVLKGVNTTQYIIKKDGKTAGMLGIGPSQDEDAGDDVYELMGLYLLPEYFRQGIGTHTIEFAFTKARSLNKRIMTVWLLEDNTNAKRFYEKCGFIADGTKREQNFGKILNSIRMRRDL
jgi:GNAT superfamily N-acetyltransferase